MNFGKPYTHKVKKSPLPRGATAGTQTLRGDVKSILYANEENNFQILRLVIPKMGEVVACGTFPGVGAGMAIEVDGSWEEHPEFGYRFRATAFRNHLPVTHDGLVRFLSSGVIPGIGEKTAQLVVSALGAKTIEVLDKDPLRLLTIPGLSRKRAEQLAAGWRSTTVRRDGMIFLQGLGLTPAFCSKLFRRYGDSAPEIVKANPYRLAEELDGIGFKRADAIALSLGISPDSPDRLTAACVYTLNQLTTQGHVCVPKEELRRAAAELADQSEAAVELGIGRAVNRSLVVIDRDMLYPPRLLRAEKNLPELIAALAGVPKFAAARLKNADSKTPNRFNTAQLHAVEAVSAAPLSIITGGPGVGKTTVIGEIVRRAHASRLKLALAAPTGRAAKRLSEATGTTAKTIHRLLQFDPATNAFAADSANPVNADLIIVDEVSMLDLPLAEALFRAIKPGTGVVLVGDRDQLPSVGPGTVLADLLNSGFFTVTHLTEVFRQAEGSRIIDNAHRVNRGELPLKEPAAPGQLSDFYWIEQEDPLHALDTIETLVAERIPLRFGFDPVEEVQILSPMNRNACGTKEINERLQARLNGGEQPSATFGERLFKLGDKVMQTANDYDKNVFNGDMGRIVHWNDAKKKFSVLFDGSRTVEYSFNEAEQLTMAYAVSIHKSQGSEFPAVVVVLLPQHYMMLQRNLLYTAMTRAKKLLILVGSRRAVSMAVQNTRLAPRFSLLAERLREMRGMWGGGEGGEKRWSPPPRPSIPKTFAQRLRRLLRKAS